MILDVIFSLHKVFKLDEGHTRLVRKEGEALKEVNEALLLLQFDLFEKGLVISFVHDCEVAIGQAFDSGGTRFIVDKSKFTKTLPCVELNYLHKEAVVDFLPLLLIMAELHLYLSNDARHQASFKFLRIFFYVWIEVCRLDCTFDAFVIKTLVRTVHTHITNGGFTNQGIRSFLLLGCLCLIVNDFHHFYVEHLLDALFQLFLRDICPNLAM